MQNGTWNVYLSGEIHSDWRERITEGVEKMHVSAKGYEQNAKAPHKEALAAEKTKDAKKAESRSSDPLIDPRDWALLTGESSGNMPVAQP